jgi:phosphohistidine swiveling domain-containing protein
MNANLDQLPLARDPISVVSLRGSDAAYVLPLNHLTRSDISRAGAKAANLGELAHAGFPVPDGFVLTTAAFERFLSANTLDLNSSPESVIAAPLPPEVSEALDSAVVVLDGARLAVRSSGVAEDLPGASFAGQYETVLDVRGAEAVACAARQCWASAFSERLSAYRSSNGQIAPGGLAVLVQRLIQADAAGVAFTANPLTGERAETVVSAVRGPGERLVSGQASPDEWLVRADAAVCQRAPEAAIDADQARAVAELARRAEAHFGGPQDVEWAIAGGQLFLLQARPMTALPERLEWKSPLPGVWLRNFRLGEWQGDPVTPLFETWLLTRLEERLNACAQANAGLPFSIPVNDQLHVVVNGWYFQGWNLPATPAQMLWLMLRHVLPKLITQPRRVSIMMPPTAHFGVELFVREWREDLLPRYRKLVESGEARVDRLAPAELVQLISEVADQAGDYFFSITAVSGFATKAEFPLAVFYKEHLYPRIGGTHQRLLRGLYTPSFDTYGHAVQSLDWVQPTLGERNLPRADPQEAAARRVWLEADRRDVEAEARAVLAGDAKLLARFERLLSTAQRFAPLREEQCYYFTLGWPLMRRALRRLGGLLCEQGVLAGAEDVFFVTRAELLAALNTGQRQILAPTVALRRLAWQRQRRLVPPLMLGELPALMKNSLAEFENAMRSPGEPSGDGLRGVPASPGRVTGPVRMILGPEDFDRLQSGEVLVAPVTTPAWTPLFARAAAVVTDTGGVGSHSSVVAREYGIPAVIGTGDATARLRDGQMVTVDGNIGLVETLS